MPKKKLTLVIPEKALASFPEEERAAVRAQIEETFQNFDPENPPGVRLIPIPIHQRVCPTCKGVLQHAHTATMPEDMGGETVEFLDCMSCDGVFERPAAN